MPSDSLVLVPELTQSVAGRTQSWASSSQPATARPPLRTRITESFLCLTVALCLFFFLIWLKILFTALLSISYARVQEVSFFVRERVESYH